MSQQPVEVYPINVAKQPSSHSNESFGAVFVVLAVIVVVSAIACFLGRLCSRRHNHHPKANQNPHHHHPKAKKNHALHEKEWEGRRNRDFHLGQRDIEFGFDPKSDPSVNKVAGKGQAKGSKPSGYGEISGEARFAGDEFRADG